MVFGVQNVRDILDDDDDGDGSNDEDEDDKAEGS